MNYIMNYGFENFDEAYDCIPRIRHGTSFDFLECRVKFYTLGEREVVFWLDGTNYTQAQAKEVLEHACKVLSYLFALPLYDKSNSFFSIDGEIELKDLLSKEKNKTLEYVEKKINRFCATKDFFYEVLDLHIIAFDNLFKDREEDAFIYFFKVIERIAKHHYESYVQRHHKKTHTKNNKNRLKNLLKNYANEVLKVELTNDILDRKTDLLYKEIKMEYYGSILGKISLFRTVKNIEAEMDMTSISEMVKLRNKIAHGGLVDQQTINNYLWKCEFLAMQMFSMYFFGKKYEDVHIGSYRFEGIEDPYEK